MLLKNILLINNIIPLLGILWIFFIPNKENKLIKLVALNCSILCFLGFLYLWICFNKSIIQFQYIYKVSINIFFNLNFIIGIDGISLVFLLLTTLLIPICFLSNWNNTNYYLKEYFLIFLLLEFFLINVFCSLDILFFYIFFECILIPMFLIIGIWGSRNRKILANYYFFIYTLIGSIIMLLGVIYIFDQTGTTIYYLILSIFFFRIEQKLLWIAFFFSFAAKIPMIPIHLWLPEAHVEAPTAGSVILAGILLKLGTYGFIRYSIVLFPIGSLFFLPFIYCLIIVGIIFCSITAIRQTDLKRVIAYTSISHMNLVLLGIFSFNVIGIEGAIFQSLNHGFIASGLFLSIGIIYDRYKTRIIQYYGGLATIMPIYILIFLFFNLANIGFPGTGNFLGEFLIFIGSFKANIIITMIAGLSLITSACYSLWLFNRIAFSNLKIQYTKKFWDLNFREILIFIPLISGSLISGLYSNIFLTLIHYNVNYLIEIIYF